MANDLARLYILQRWWPSTVESIRPSPRTKHAETSRRCLKNRLKYQPRWHAIFKYSPIALTLCVPLLQVLTTNPIFSSLLRYFRHRPFRGCYNKAMTKLPTCCSLSSSAFSSLRPSSSAACAGLLCFSKILGPSHCRGDRGKNGNFTGKNGDF